MYAQIINGALVEAPKQIQHNGYIYHNPTEEIYIANGYYPVVETTPPEMVEEYGKYCELTYVMKENRIIQTWVEKEDFVPEMEEEYIDTGVEAQPSEASQEEMLKSIIIGKIRKRYSIDDEIAILRQRDSKPEEFQEYYNYAEQCKTEAKLVFATPELPEEEQNQNSIEDESEL